MATWRTSITPLAAALLLVMVTLLQTTSGAHALCISNQLKHKLTIVDPPGCCKPPCPAAQPNCVVAAVCVQCASVVVKAGKKVTLQFPIGPFPLPQLKVHILKQTYCVAEADLRYTEESASLVVGPWGVGPCGASGKGVVVYVLKGSKLVAKLCLLPCSNV